MAKERETELTRETDAYLDDEATPGAQGSTGGRLAREVGIEDDEKVAEEDAPGHTGVTKSNQQSSDDKRDAG